MLLAQTAAFGAACSDDGVGAGTSNNGTLEPGTELVSFGAASGTTSETGAQASFDVVLAVKPSADVVVKLGSNDPGEGISDVSTLTFTPENWNAPQTVTVTGQDDDPADGDQEYAIVFEALESEDARFAGYEPGEVALVNVDDETAGFTVSEADGDTSSDDADYAAIKPESVELSNIDDETPGVTVAKLGEQTPEAGGQAQFTVVLNSEPCGDVHIGFDSSDPSEGAVDVSSLTFTPANWDTPQVVTVSGVDDATVDDDQSYQIVFVPAVSTDAGYAGRTPDSVAVTNLDNDFTGSCAAVLASNPLASSGTYSIDPDGTGPAPTREAYCDMQYNGGGWTNLDFDANRIWLANGIYVDCTGGLSANATQVTCSSPYFMGDTSKPLYHHSCDGSDNSADYILDHMAPLLGHQSAMGLGFSRLGQRRGGPGSMGDEKYCYVDGQMIHYSDALCAPYSSPDNGNCAPGVFTLTL